jgi:hypothetical protein
MGVGGDFNYLDGLLKADLYQKWNLSPFELTPGPAITAKAYATIAVPTSTLLLPEQWDKTNVMEIGGSGTYKTIVDADSAYTFASASGGVGFTSSPAPGVGPSRGYTRFEAAIGAVRPLVAPTSQVHVRLFGGVAHNAPRQRAIFASSQDPFETFNNDLFRPRGALFKQDNVNYLPLGGAGLRGFALTVPLDGVFAANAEVVQRLALAGGGWGRASLAASLFADLGSGTSKLVTLSNSLMSDLGVGLVLRGHLYDRNVYIRLDSPVFVNQAGLAGGHVAGAHTGSVALRWLLTVGDLW